MKAKTKTVGKKPMMKAKKGMTVKDPGDGALGKLSAKVAGAIGTGVAAIGAAAQARKVKKAKEAEAAIKEANRQKVESEKKNSTAKELEEMGAGYKRKGGVTKKMYGGKTMKSGGTKKK